MTVTRIVRFIGSLWLLKLCSHQRPGSATSPAPTSRALASRLAVLKGFYTATVPDRELRIGPDASTVLEFGSDGFAQLKDAATGRDLSPRLAHSAPISAIAFSPEGTKLATWARDRHLRLWSVPEGRPLANWHTPELPGKILFNPSQSMLATIGRRESPGRDLGRIRFWQLPEGRETTAPTFPFDFQVGDAAFSPDGAKLAFSYQRDGSNLSEVTLADVRTGKTLELPVSDLYGFHALRFGGGSKTMLLQSVAKTLIVEVATGQPILSNPIRPPSLPEIKTPDQALFTVGFLTADGKTMALGDNLGYAQFRNTSEGELYAPIFRHGTAVDNMAVSPDGQTALIVGGFTGRLTISPPANPWVARWSFRKTPGQAGADIETRPSTQKGESRRS